MVLSAYLGGDNMHQNQYMKEAIEEAYIGIRSKHGGPFGCVIVKDGKIIGRGHNRVLLNKDATCHGEIEAIRDASSNIGSHDLSGAELYTTAAPCPMCKGAILWANIDKVYYGCNVVRSLGSILSEGSSETIFAVGGLAVGFVAAMLIFRKKKVAVSSMAADDEE